MPVLYGIKTKNHNETPWMREADNKFIQKSAFNDTDYLNFNKTFAQNGNALSQKIVNTLFIC